MLVKRQILQGEGDTLSIVSEFPAQGLVGASPHLSPLVQLDVVQRKIQSGAWPRNIAEELVAAGIYTPITNQSSFEDADNVGRQFSDGVSQLHEEAGGTHNGANDFIGLSIKALNRALNNDKNMSQNVRLAAYRARFELGLRRIRTRNGLGHLVASTMQGNLFVEGAALLSEALGHDDVPHRYFDRNPKLLANTVIVAGAAKTGSPETQELAVRLWKGVQSPKGQHANVINQAMMLQSQGVCPDSAPLELRRSSYPAAVDLITKKVFDDDDLRDRAHARQLVLATAVPPSES